MRYGAGLHSADLHAIWGLTDPTVMAALSLGVLVLYAAGFMYLAVRVFIAKTVNLGAKCESLFLGGFLIFVWSAPQGLVVIRIHDNQNPPTIVIIVSDADFNRALLHVGFIQG